MIRVGEGSTAQLNPVMLQDRLERVEPAAHTTVNKAPCGIRGQLPSIERIVLCDLAMR